MGGNAARDVDAEHVSFLLQKKMETTRNVPDKKAFLEIESTDKFDRNIEEICSLMMEFDGG